MAQLVNMQIITFALTVLILLGIVQAQEPIATSCTEWGSKFQGPLWGAPESAKCRTGSGTSSQFCCVLYARLDAVIRFFVAEKPTGLGCKIGQGSRDTFRNLYFNNCAAFADKLPANVSAPTQPTITPTVSPSPSPSPSVQISIDIIPGANTTISDVNSTTIPTPSNTTVPTVTEGTTTVEEVPEAGETRANVNATGGRICLHGALTVQLHDRIQSVRVDALKVGDIVPVGNGIHSTVFMFTHQARIRAEFLNATTKSGLWLAVTPGHLVHVHGNGLVPASQINIGDSLVKQDSSADPIVNLNRFVDIGTYNPQTLHGDIVVNGLRVSTYTTHVAAQAAHPALAPLRAVWRTLRWSTPIFRCGVPSLSSLAGHPCVE